MLKSFQLGSWGGEQIEEESKAPCCARLQPADSRGERRGAAGEESRSPAAARPQPWPARLGPGPGLQPWPGRRCPGGCRCRGSRTSAPPAEPAPVKAAKPGCLRRERRAGGLPGHPGTLGRRRGAPRMRGQRRREAITSPLRPALIPSHGVRGAGSPNKAQSG